MPSTAQLHRRAWPTVTPDTARPPAPVAREKTDREVTGLPMVILAPQPLDSLPPLALIIGRCYSLVSLSYSMDRLCNSVESLSSRTQM